jgi:peptidoglycan hydrolase-like protein with peptidoglycan-binding domain
MNHKLQVTGNDMTTLDDAIYRKAFTSVHPAAVLAVANAFEDKKDHRRARALRHQAQFITENKFTFGAVGFGSDIASIQARLNALGASPPLDVDGVSGPKTLEAIKAFQNSHGIEPDGIVGPITLAAMGMTGDETSPIVAPSTSGSGIIAVKGLETKSPQFLIKLVDVSNALGINPDWLATVESFESAGTFSPSVQNPTSHATGLIQFMPSTARNLGTTIEELANMTDIGQLDYVYKYLSSWKGRMKSLDDTYLAIFMPSQMGKPSDSVVASEGSAVYNQNSGFDRDKKGYFTVGDITSAIHGVYNAGLKRGRIAVPGLTSTTVAAGAGIAIAAVGAGLLLWLKSRGMA